MPDPFARLLRLHRVHRRLSQEQLGLEAEVSARHLSCLETGKSRPSREMVLLLASVLGLELRDRNTLLTSAGFVGRNRAAARATPRSARGRGRTTCAAAARTGMTGVPAALGARDSEVLHRTGS